LASIAVFASVLSPVAPGHGSCFSGLVDAYGVSRVMLAFRTVSVDLFWILHWTISPGERPGGVNCPHLSIFLFQRSFGRLNLHHRALAYQALAILPGKTGDVFLDEWSVGF